MTTITAQLGFLAIYNPSLGTSDETLDEQIVYYASRKLLSKKRRRNRRRGGLADVTSPEERNERLRQIGLAQGMVEFGRSFAGNQAVDFVDTEGSRVIMHELEAGWWILASIDLTRLPLPPKLATGKQTAPLQEKYEYSTRDLKPANLLLCDLLRAHSIFLLHHAPSLSLFLERRRKSHFLTVLGRYWDLFLSTWDVMLHGNPLRSLVGGISLAASGELGVGVGEEESGSGERDVLEGLPWRMDGLVDLVVSKFGTVEDEPENDITISSHTTTAVRPSWIGSGKEPSASDGAIFLGVGALSRNSLREIVHWAEDLYTWGENTYGVVNPSSAKPSRKSRRGTFSNTSASLSPLDREQEKHQRRNSMASGHPDDTSRRKLRDIPPVPIQEPTHEEAPLPSATRLLSQSIPQSLMKLSQLSIFSSDAPPDGSNAPAKPSQPKEPSSDKANLLSVEQSQPIVAEGCSNTSIPPDTVSNIPKRQDLDTKALQAPIVEGPGDGAMDKFKNYLKLGYGTYWSLGTQEASKSVEKPKPQSSSGIVPIIDPRKANDPTNHFLIGLRREADPLLTEDDISDASDTTDSLLSSATILRRTVYVTPRNTNSTENNNKKHAKLRVVVYVNRPFIFVLLFDPSIATTSLSSEPLYNTLHTQLSAVRNALIKSTAHPIPRPVPGIFDMIYDPSSLALLCSVPNIPVPISGPPAPAGVIGGVEPRKDPWSRADAVSTHLHMLNILTATSRQPNAIERSAKTSRGWWIVWARVLKELDESAAMPATEPVSSGLETITESPVASAHDVSSLAKTSDDGASGHVSSRTCTPPPIHPFIKHTCAVHKEVFLVRRASDHASWRSFSASLMETVEGASASSSIASAGGADASGDSDGPLSIGRAAGAGFIAAAGEGGVAGGLARGIGVDTRKYIEGLAGLL
ncbi:hypothetical protein Cpir12675_004160 [Ceratocystis pirilliformis]|uniref:CCZ1/INTU/HSP4 first Longin domain-containing protein n=1 Tax=Ceratocystis pirilliformis TaxID=259994 RepID=A0ABR3YZL7_9PEZI